METAKIFLTVLSGVAWTYVYWEAIRVGFRHQAYAIPFVALCLNIGWEIVYGVIGLSHATGFSSSLSIQAYIIGVWLALDCLILYTFIAYAKAEAAWSRFTRAQLAGIVCVALATSLGMHLILNTLLGTSSAATYAAFLQNLAMSILFIRLLRRRTRTYFRDQSGSIRGQSLSIGYGKFVGTLAATLIFGVLEMNLAILLIGSAVFYVDVYYILLLRRQLTKVNRV